MAQAVSYGSITIVDTNDIEEIYMIYAGSNSSDSMPTFTYAAVTGGTIWKRDASQVTGNYIWQSTVVTKSGVDITSSNWTSFYGVPVCITGPEGADARKITSVVPYYYLSTSNTGQTGGSWNTTPSTYPSTGTSYYWTKTVTTYDSGNPTESAPVLDMALTNAAKDSRDANSAASQAVSIATDAQENSEGALSQSTTLDVKLKNFFWPGDSDYPGAYAVGKGTNDGLDAENISTYGYNLCLTPVTLSIGYNQFKAIEIDGSNPALKFYKPSKTTQGAQTAQLDANGLVLSEGGIEAGNAGQSGFIYLSTENYGSNLTINGHQAPNWKEIIGTKFGVDADGNLYASNATISGAITATSLSTGTKTSETTGKGVFINSSGAIYSGDGNVNNFIINEYGAITAKSGTIGGWTIDSNSIHSSDKTIWDKDEDGIFIGNYLDENYFLTEDTERKSGKTYYEYDSQHRTYSVVQNPASNPKGNSYYEKEFKSIFTISGGKIQYIETEDIEANPNTTYYKIKYIISEDTEVNENKTYYIKNEEEKYIEVVNPSGSPSENNYYEKTDEYIEVIDTTGKNPKDQEWYISLGPMWYINSDGSASFGSLLVNQTGKLDVPAASITGKLTADQIEVENLSAISANIGSTINSETTSNNFEVNSEKKIINSSDTIQVTGKEYIEETIKSTVNELEDYHEGEEYLLETSNIDSYVLIQVPADEATLTASFYCGHTNQNVTKTFTYGTEEEYVFENTNGLIWVEYDGQITFTLYDNSEGLQLINVVYSANTTIESNLKEIVEESFIELNTEKNEYALTEDTEVKSGKNYYVFKPNYSLTDDENIGENKIYYDQIIGSGSEGFSYEKVSNPAENPKENNYYETHPKYELVTTSSGDNPQTNSWYELIDNYSAGITLEEGVVSITSNDITVAATDNSQDFLNIYKGNIAGEMKIGNLEVVSVDGGLTIRLG